MFSVVLLSLIAVLVVTIYFYIKWKYYTLRGSVPGLEPEFLFGNLRQLGIITSNKELIDSYIHGCEKMQKLYGDIFQFWLGANHFYVFCRPEHAEEIYTHRHIFDRADMRIKTFGLVAENTLIATIGSKYKRHARAILPMLKKHKFVSQTLIITNCVDQLIDIWKQRYENKDDDNICTCLVNDNQQLLLDLFTLITFDYDLGNLKRLAKSAISLNTKENFELSEMTNALFTWLNTLKRITINGIPYFINYYLLKFDRKFQNALKILEKYIEKIIIHCQQETDPDMKPINLVASLVSSLQDDENLERLKPEIEKKGISKKELLDELLGLIAAGFDTSSNVISWFIYYVSKKPEIQQKIKEELKQNGIRKETSLHHFDLLNECKYIDCVLKETLRLAPIGLGGFRTLIDDTVIDGVKLCKGDTVCSLMHFMQQDPRNWKLDPTQFIPERFYGTDAPDINHHPFAYSPFGGGHRACAGQELARLELKIIITRLMQFVTFVDTPGNNGGHRQQMAVAPKDLAVEIKFD
ncbi:unnamed protein product [Adineta steineri]|uniref:Cytochrome P450 n=1 Tax=Adineta steineri TaxID=433720 RepID=A0A815B1J6_9BILA|nr:unnamed protein product [Adineta steineri]